ncbi:ribosome-associated translation inhibitor RaiA [Candidatus Nomurabacteria bacterium]|nr:ribosome-associated translation inhibitor RaiA [Candidatus Nomurabacteria bacterium]
MTFPTINYKYNSIPEAEELALVVDQKMNALEKFLHGDESITCDVEFEKVAPKQNGQVHRVEINLMVDGTMYRAESTEESFEKAIDKVRDEVVSELRKAKEKQITLDKQGGRAVKEQMLEG